MRCNKKLTKTAIPIPLLLFLIKYFRRYDMTFLRSHANNTWQKTMIKYSCYIYMYVLS